MTWDGRSYFWDKTTDKIERCNYDDPRLHGPFDEVRRVAHDKAADGCRVSTVFLGRDHNFDAGDPILFETMVFGGEFDQMCTRYETADAARSGHAVILEALNDGDRETLEKWLGVPWDRLNVSEGP